MKIYVLLECGQFSGEIERFTNRKQALKAMLKYNLEQATYNQWAKKVNKYGFHFHECKFYMALIQKTNKNINLILYLL